MVVETKRQGHNSETNKMDLVLSRIVITFTTDHLMIQRLQIRRWVLFNFGSQGGKLAFTIEGFRMPH